MDSTSGSLVVGIAGAVVGGLIGGALTGFTNPAAIKMGASLGWMGGSALGRLLFKGDGDQKPKRGDLILQTSTYGATRPIVYGSMRVAGNIIWTSTIRAATGHAQHGSEGGTISPADDGGWGGMFTGSTPPSEEDIEYKIDVAVAFCEGPVDGILRIWADGKLVYNATGDGQPFMVGSSGIFGVNIYLGDEAQLADPVIVAIEGANVTPAYRKTCYIVFKSLLLKHFGNRIPNFTVEVTNSALSEFDTRTVTPTNGVAADNFVVSKISPMIYALKGDYLLSIDRTSGTIVQEVDIATAIEAMPITYSDPTGPTIGSAGAVSVDSKLIVDEGNDFLYLCCRQGTSSFLVKVNYLGLQPMYHNQNTANASSYEYEGMCVGYQISSPQKMLTADKQNQKIRCYEIPTFSNGGTFTLLWTAVGPSNTSLVPGNMTQDQYGIIWIIWYNLADTGTFWLTRVDMGGYCQNYQFTGTDYRCKSIIYWKSSIASDVDEAIICYGGQGKMFQVTGLEYPNTPVITVSTATDKAAGDQRANALSQRRNSGYFFHALHNSGATCRVRWIRLSDFSLIKDTQISSWGLAIADGIGLAFDTQHSSYWLSSTNTQQFIEILAERLTTSPFVLGDIVNDVFNRVGLVSTEYDAPGNTANLSDIVTGFVISRMTSARNALDPLMGTYLFDIAEIDGKLICKKRDGNILSGSYLDKLFADPNANGNVSRTSSTLAVTANNTFTDASANFTTLGFVAGDRIRTSGWSNGANNGFFTLQTVTTTTLVITTTTLVVEGAAAGHTVKTQRVFPLPETELGVHEYGGDLVPKIVETQIQEADLPRRVTLGFIDKDRDYDSHTEFFQRNMGATTKTMNSQQEMSVDVPIVLTPDTARSVAKKMLLAAWTEARSYAISLSPRWILLDPMDIISLTVGGTVTTVRITQIEDGNNYLREVSTVRESSLVYSKTSTAQARAPLENPLKPRVSTEFDLLDLPLYKPVGDDPGIYVYAGPRHGASADWIGATIYKSPDGGAHYDSVAFFQDNEGATHGQVLTAIPDTSPVNSFDYTTTIDVFVAYRTLTSKTQAQVLDGANLCVMGDEYIQFQTATSLGGRKYRLSKLLRYRFGTEWAGASHTIGERFLLIENRSVKRISGLLSEINLVRAYRGVSLGQGQPQGIRRDVTNTGRGLKPYAPTKHLDGIRWDYSLGAVSGGAAIRFFRRTRLGGHWQDEVDIPIGETSEAYECDVYETATDDLLRTLTGTNDYDEEYVDGSAPAGTMIYTSAMALADLGVALPTVGQVYFVVYQMSSKIGRGFPTRMELDAIINLP